MGRLDGKTALVTGGGRGIGRGIVLEFAREGADVAINYRRDKDAAETTVRDVQGLGRRAIAVRGDVSQWDQVSAMVAEAVGFLGGLDIAVANSGVASRFQTVADLDPGEWKRVTSTDLDGAFYTAKAVIPHVVARKGVVLFISSVGADMAAARGAPYHSSKAAVNALARVLAKEVASAGVRVNCIAPGLVRSDMGNKLIGFFGEGLVQTIPLGRAGEPVDIGRAAVFLASDDGGWITGKILRVDGGACM
ncbi:MAG TPA: glucose 1-dehydrogenase [Candidatus Eisenbacteria bacterium]|nr:glucose 1-dehydrogenase [Candidatus Eisenbacteria bacterium]